LRFAVLDLKWVRLEKSWSPEFKGAPAAFMAGIPSVARTVSLEKMPNPFESNLFPSFRMLPFPGIQPILR
jgi:hypothetical protein